MGNYHFFSLAGCGTGFGLSVAPHFLQDTPKAQAENFAPTQPAFPGEVGAGVHGGAECTAGTAAWDCLVVPRLAPLHAAVSAHNEPKHCFSLPAAGGEPGDGPLCHDALQI